MPATTWLPTLTLTLYLLVATGTALQDNDFDFDSTDLHATDHEFAPICLRLCRCYRAALTPGRSAVIVQCHHLSNLPHATPRSTKSLVLHDSNIGRIEDASLQHQGLRLLEDFECSGCQITTISLNAFRHLLKLKTIVLSNNSITDLRPDHFANQKRLTLLVLTGNPELDCKQLENGLPKTRVLCDSGTNTLETVEEIVTVPTADKAGETESNVTSSSVAPDDTDDTDKEGDVPSVSHSSLTVGFFVGMVAGVVSVVLAIVYRRRIIGVCQGMPRWMGQEWMSLLKDGKVETHERSVDEVEE